MQVRAAGAARLEIDPHPTAFEQRLAREQDAIRVQPDIRFRLLRAAA